MKYAHIFANTTERDNYVFSNDYVEPFVAIIRDENYEVSDAAYNRFYDVDITEDLYNIPLTAGILSNGNFTLRASHTGVAKTIEYKKNDGAWTSVNVSTTTITIPVSAGDKLSFRGNNDTYGANLSSANQHCAFGCYDSGTTCSFILYGNIMSLISKENFNNLTQLTGTYTFEQLFRNDYGLKDASGLVLPATVLALNSYASLFNGVQFRYPPRILPATYVASAAYNSMFAWNWNLIETPEIYAKSVEQWGCSGMFAGCSALRKSPSLQISNLLGQYACQGMFKNTPIERIPYLPLKTLSPYCCYQMFENCSAATQFPVELPATDLNTYCYGMMFKGCKGMEEAPILPATEKTNSNFAYSGMFSGCTNLFRVTSYLNITLPQDLTTMNTTLDWLAGVASQGILYKSSGATYSSNDTSGLPNGWTSRNVFIQ